jgi:Fe-S cluster biosynthesis and repair protein YggX
LLIYDLFIFYLLCSHGLNKNQYNNKLYKRDYKNISNILLKFIIFTLMLINNHILNLVYLKINMKKLKRKNVQEEN